MGCALGPGPRGRHAGAASREPGACPPRAALPQPPSPAQQPPRSDSVSPAAPGGRRGADLPGGGAGALARVGQGRGLRRARAGLGAGWAPAARGARKRRCRPAPPSAATWGAGPARGGAGEGSAGGSPRQPVPPRPRHPEAAPSAPAGLAPGGRGGGGGGWRRGSGAWESPPTSDLAAGRLSGVSCARPSRPRPLLRSSPRGQRAVGPAQPRGSGAESESGCHSAASPLPGTPALAPGSPAEGPSRAFCGGQSPHQPHQPLRASQQARQSPLGVGVWGRLEERGPAGHGQGSRPCSRPHGSAGAVFSATPSFLPCLINPVARWGLVHDPHISWSAGGTCPLHAQKAWLTGLGEAASSSGSPLGYVTLNGSSQGTDRRRPEGPGDHG
ncbi:translation initiation factor IF-2-like [Lutra lutra]|uniref:translation initiation factor IF-2-like n=1 Tax=Lutra lutra TaxID=9657 RepID=UPI001FCFD380|nr:translation initiation factor IF-2-like [Lutra lutra]